MPEEKLRPTYTFTEDRLAELRAVVPEAFEGGSINWDTLRDLLAPHLADESQDAENFGLSWPGKREARRLAAKPSGNTLRPAPGEGVNEDTTHNLYLEGDNLEVLKLLQKSYAGQVKMIYIDPPYNTGNDFVYKDNFTEPSEDYLRRTGQMGERGELLTSNPKTDGRFHSNWLSMIYPRLRLARTLLRDDGVIFVSIGDDEFHNLRAIMNEIFGEENFCGVFIWEKKKKPSFLNASMGVVTEYILAFAKQRDMSPAFVAGTVEDGKMYPFNNAGNALGTLKFPASSVKFNFEDAVFEPQDMSSGNIITKLLDHLEVKNGTNVDTFKLEGEWRYSQAKVNQFITDGDEIVIRKAPFRPNYVNRADKAKKTSNLLTVKTTGMATYEDATEEVTQLFGADIVDYPKPSKLLKFLVSCVSDADDVILDFFAGSSSTAHATLELNKEDGGTRRFLMVQLPEPTASNSPASRAYYKTIAEMGKERIRRVIKQINAKLSLALLEIPNDLGFKVLTLGPSNFRAWRDYTGDSIGELQQQFDLFEESPLAEGWTPDGLLTEVLLLEGFPLDSAIAPQPQWKENTVSCITSPACAHRLWTCFDETLYPDTVDGMALSTKDVFICRESALDDNAKLRLSQTGTLKTI